MCLPAFSLPTSRPVPAVNLPNSITLTRILQYSAADLAALHQPFSAPTGSRNCWPPALFIAASITDGIDGYLARKRGQITTMGILLDPLADKLLIAAAFITLVQFNPSLVPAWIAVVIIAPRISGERLAFHCRLGRFHHRGQRTGQVQNAGADHLRGGGHPGPPLARSGRLGSLHFPRALDCPLSPSGSWFFCR